MRTRFVALAVLVAANGVTGCARPLPQVGLGSLEGVREARFPAVGTWRREDGALTNVIPRGVSSDDVLNARNGIGVSLGILPDFAARDLAIQSDLTFERTGAPSVVFRAQFEDGVVVSMYSLVLYSRGVNLWRLKDGEWIPLHRHVFPVAPSKRHALRADCRGDTIAVSLDGRKLFESRDTLLMEPGRAGICGREGVCRFFTLAIEQRDE